MNKNIKNQKNKDIGTGVPKEIHDRLWAISANVSRDPHVPLSYIKRNIENSIQLMAAQNLAENLGIRVTG